MGARRAHAVAKHPDTTLVSVTDVDASLAREVAASLDCDVAADVKALVARTDLDTVVVCSPNRLHMPHAIAAMENGKHVICEKPLACTPAEAVTMVQAAERCSVTLKVGSNLRFFDSVQKAQELLSAGSVGEPFSLRGWIGNDGWAAKSWFIDPALSGGGTILDNGCHLFDLARWFVGDAKTCTGSTYSLYWDAAVEDNGVGLFTIGSGGFAVIHSSWTEWTTYFCFDVYGPEGVVTVENRLPTRRTTLVRRDGVRRVFDFTAPMNDTYGMELAAYVDARRLGTPPEPTGMDGLRVVEMADAVYRSAASGSAVVVASAAAPQ